MKFWISGYGGKSGGLDMPSIYLYDTENPQPIVWETAIAAPSYLDYEGDRLFSLCEHEEKGSVTMFRRAGSVWNQLDTKQIHGTAFCHLRYWKRQGVLAGACYGTGHVFTVDVQEDSIGEIKSWIRQSDAEISRAHCIEANVQETRAYSANIALDRLYYYDIEDGKLTNEQFLQLPLEEGIRHLLIREDLGKIYATTEYSNRILTIDISGARPEYVSSTRTLSPDFAGISHLSGLKMTRDGKLLFAANRGADTITVFQQKDGNLEKTGEYSCLGKWPREIAFLDNETKLAIANQRSNSVVVFSLSTDGALGEMQQVIPFMEPSFVGEYQEGGCTYTGI